MGIFVIVVFFFVGGFVGLFVDKLVFFSFRNFYVKSVGLIVRGKKD